MAYPYMSFMALRKIIVISTQFLQIKIKFWSSKKLCIFLNKINLNFCTTRAIIIIIGKKKPANLLANYDILDLFLFLFFYGVRNLLDPIKIVSIVAQATQANFKSFLLRYINSSVAIREGNKNPYNYRTQNQPFQQLWLAILHHS